MLNRVSGAVLGGFVALTALTFDAPARADTVVSSSCLGGFFTPTSSCVVVRREGAGNPHIIKVPGPRTDQEFAEAQARERRWVARCKPVARQDQYGVMRYSYAAPGCEFGKYE